MRKGNVIFMALIIVALSSSIFLMVGISMGGELPYDYRVTSIEGEEYSFRQLRGKTFVLVAYDSSMPDCRERIGRFIDLSKEFEKGTLEFIAVDIGMSKKEAFVGTLPQDWGGVRFFKDYRRNVVQGLKVQIIPTTYFFSGDGNLKEKIESNYMWNSSRFKGEVEKLIRGK